MNTENVLFFPHKEYNIETEITDNLRCREYIHYGYIKLRDLEKWQKNKVVSVKMGMLSPLNKSYRGLSIFNSAILRIKEQDTTALFDNEDELIPVYIFVSDETDIMWREYLYSCGFTNSRTTANREGIRIKKSDIKLQYGLRYNIETEEVLSYIEKKNKEKKQKLSSKKYKELKEKLVSYIKQGYTIKNLSWGVFECFSLCLFENDILFGKGNSHNDYIDCQTNIEELPIEDIQRIVEEVEERHHLEKEQKTDTIFQLIGLSMVFILVFGLIIHSLI